MVSEIVSRRLLTQIAIPSFSSSFELLSACRDYFVGTSDSLTRLDGNGSFPKDPPWSPFICVFVRGVNAHCIVRLFQVSTRAFEMNRLSRHVSTLKFNPTLI
jgi:hypothetical protein